MKTLRQKLKVVSAPDDPSEQGGYLLDDQAGFLMRIAMQRHTSIFTSRMVAELTQTQFAALAKLYEVGPCSQNHLGRLIYLDAATIKGVVDRLHVRGFLSAVKEAAMKVAAEITAATLTPLTTDEQRMLAKMLGKLA